MSDCYYDAAGCLVCPEQDARAFVPGRIEHKFVLGWNSGANSITVLDGNLHAVFDMPLGEIGVVLGLKSSRAQVTNPAALEHGWYFQHAGGLDIAQPIERGQLVGTIFTSRTATTLFEIRRVNGEVTYWAGTQLFAASVMPSAGSKLLGTCLYATGDTVPSAP